MQQNSLAKRDKFYQIPSSNIPYFYNLCESLSDLWKKYNNSLLFVNIWRCMNSSARRIFFDIDVDRLYGHFHPYPEVAIEKSLYPFPSGENPSLHNWQTYVAKYP